MDSSVAIQVLNAAQGIPPGAPVDFTGLTVAASGQRLDVERQLGARDRAKMNERLLFCRQVRELIDAGRGKGEAVALIAAHAEQYPILVRSGHDGTSALTGRNYSRWLLQLGKHRNGRPNWDNTQALADRYTCSVRERYGAPEFWRLFGGFYLNLNRPSFPEAYTNALLLARQARIADGETPSLSQVKYWFEHSADKTAVMLARYGENHTKSAAIGYLLRDPSGLRVGELWYGDHHQFDVALRVWEDAQDKWIPTRPWLTAWMDARSHYFPGWIIRAGEYPDSLAIEEALLAGIRANGNRPPRILATDNGKDYCSAGFVDPVTFDGAEHAIRIELGCQHTTALPYNARSKTIEREFRTICESFAKWWPSYRGNCPANRPETAAEHWNNPERLPTLQQFSEGFSWWLQHVYYLRETKSKWTDGRAPEQAWDARPEVMPALSDERLFFAFLKPVAQPRKVGRGGMVQLAGQVYQSDRLWPYLGQDVLVKVDRFSADHIYCYTLDGKLLAEATRPAAVPAYAETDTGRALIGTMTAKYRRQLTNARTAVREMTGGIRVIHPIARMQLAQPAAGGLPPADSSGVAIHAGLSTEDAPPVCDPERRRRAAEFEAAVVKSLAAEATPEGASGAPGSLTAEFARFAQGAYQDEET